MKALLTIIQKEFLQFRRDKKMFGITFVAPVLQLVLLGYAANFDVTDISTLVCDQDRTPASREIIGAFGRSGYFEIVERTDDTRGIERRLESGRVSMALVVPRGFGRDLAAGKQVKLQAIVDGADATAAATGLTYASQIVMRRSEKIMLESLSRLGGAAVSRVNAEVRVWYNPELRSRNFMVPGILALLLMVMTMMLTSLAIVREKEIGTLEQLMVTPVRPWQIILGKLAPFVMIGFVDVALVVLAGNRILGVPIRGSVPLLFGLSGIFLMTTLGLGLLISTVSDTQQQAMMTAVFFVLLPMIFFSGFVFPIQNMPEPMQVITYILPLRYYFTIIRGIFLKGVGMTVLWQPALILFGFGVLIFTVSVGRFKKSIG